jgi:hypothetical protein
MQAENASIVVNGQEGGAEYSGIRNQSTTREKTVDETARRGDSRVVPTRIIPAGPPFGGPRSF